MTLEELAGTLEETGLPVTYFSWPEEAAPPLPYLCYFETESEPFYADGTVYYDGLGIRVELYEDLRNPELEERVENVLSGIGPWTKEIDYLDSEKCFAVFYDMEV